MHLPIGIIGCGGHAAHHAKNFGSSFILRGVWDTDKEARKKLGKLHKAKSYDSAEELLNDERIQAVMICSPDEFHLDQIEMAIEAGKHVFCEKPLLVPTQSIRKLKDLFAIARAKKLVLTSCHPRRFDRYAMWFREAHRHQNPSLLNSLGKVMGFKFDFSYHKPSSTWKSKRSLLLDHINHEVDLMNYFFGLQPFKAWKLSDGFDRYQVVGIRSDGITFDFNGTRMLTDEKYPEWCRIRFEQGTVVFDTMHKIVEVRNHNENSITIIPNMGIDYDARLASVMHNFYDQIMNGVSENLTEKEMIMNTQAGTLLQEEGIIEVSVS